MSIKHNKKQSDSSALGSSVYGGRPTFALVREEKGNNVSLTLYQLLPEEQAVAQRRRLERHCQQVSKAIPFYEVINDDIHGVEDWKWDDWVAIKIRRVSGARLRSLLQVLNETLHNGEIDPSEITGTGDSTILLREETGIRLSLGFIGIKPLQRVDRMRMLARGLSQMSLEECYYWHAKCQSPSTPNGAKALRTLLIADK